MAGESETPASGQVQHDSRAEGWSAITGEFLETGHGNSMWRVFWSFIRTPVKTILRLTDDPSYRSHWGFLSACLGAQLTLTYVILPRLFALIYSAPAADSKSTIIIMQIIQYTGIAILTPLQFYVCRALGTIRRTPMSYLKLCVLSVSYCAILSALGAIAYWGLGAGLISSGIAFDAAELGTWVNAAGQLAIIVFVTMVHRRFWGMRLAVAIAVTVGIAIASWYVVYPALGSAAMGANLPALIEQILG